MRPTVNTGVKAYIHNVLSRVYCCILSCLFAGVMPFECYEGAVYVVYNDKTVSGTRFTGVTTLESGKTQEELTSGNLIIYYL